MSGDRTRIAGLTAYEAEIMRSMYRMKNKRATPHLYGETELGWAHPRDIGGTAQSFHSKVMATQALRGFLEVKPFAAPSNHGQRPARARVYRITSIGETVYEMYAEHMQQQRATELRGLGMGAVHAQVRAEMEAGHAA